MIQLSITTKFIFRQLFLSKLIRSLVMAFVILTAVKVRVFSTPNYMCRHDFRNGYGFKISTSSECQTRKVTYYSGLFSLNFSHENYFL